MTLRRHLALALFGAMLFASPLAHAQDQEDPEPEVSDQGPESEAVYDRYLALQVSGGFDTPFGVAGAAIEFSPVRYLAIYAGGGIGRDGGRFAGGLWGRYPIGNAAVGLMVGLGGGALGWDSAGGEAFHLHRYWDMGLFIHSGISFEYRWPEGIFGRLSFGAEGLVTGDPDQCRFDSGAECNAALAADLSKPVRAWAGLTIGYALDL